MQTLSQLVTLSIVLLLNIFDSSDLCGNHVVVRVCVGWGGGLVGRVGSWGGEGDRSQGARAYRQEENTLFVLEDNLVFVLDASAPRHELNLRFVQEVQGSPPPTWQKVRGDALRAEEGSASFWWAGVGESPCRRRGSTLSEKRVQNESICVP